MRPPTLEPVLCSYKSTHQLIVEKYWEIQTPGRFRTLELSQTAMFSLKINLIPWYLLALETLVKHSIQLSASP